MRTALSFSELLADTGVDPARPFGAPWEARAFAIAMRLAESGVCT